MNEPVYPWDIVAEHWRGQAARYLERAVRAEELLALVTGRRFQEGCRKCEASKKIWERLVRERRIQYVRRVG